MLGAGVAGVVFAIAPLVAASAGVAETAIWRPGNGVTPFLHLFAAARFLIQIRPKHWFDPGPERITGFLIPIPAALILSQLAAALGFLSNLSPFLYLAMLLWYLVVGLLQFMFLFIRARAA